MADAQTEKYTNPKYNQDDFLDELIKKEIEGSEIKGDVVIIDGWAFELDRSVPKIGHDLGRADKLVFPEVNATVKLADDKKNATIEITAIEETNGINKIEIWQLGEMIKEYTYEDVKIEITVNPPYTAIQNGTYTIKVYGKLMASKIVKVEGIVASVKFEPNGNSEWKKAHSTKVTIQETVDRIVSSKYYWINSVTEPEDDKFTEKFNSEDTITKSEENKLTGTYYLWTMLETQSGEKIKWRSEGFNFDNKGPEVTLTSTGLTYSSFKLNLTALDEESGIDTYEIFVDNVSQGRVERNGIKTTDTKELTVNNVTYGDTTCYVIVTDILGNQTKVEIIAQTEKDTEGPQISGFNTAKYSIDGITLDVTTQDELTGIKMIKYYIDDVEKGTETFTNVTKDVVTKSINITGIDTGTHNCKVIVWDNENNTTTRAISGTTKLYVWNKYATTSKQGFKIVGAKVKQTSRIRFSSSTTYCRITDDVGTIDLEKATVTPIDNSFEFKSNRNSINGNTQFPGVPCLVYRASSSLTTYTLWTTHTQVNASSSGWSEETGEYYKLEATSIPAIGAQEGTVTGNSISSFPTDGAHTDGKWYIYQGIEN